MLKSRWILFLPSAARTTAQKGGAAAVRRLLAEVAAGKPGYVEVADAHMG